jgi:hypothetical protein
MVLSVSKYKDGSDGTTSTEMIAPMEDLVYGIHTKPVIAKINHKSSINLLPNVRYKKRTCFITSPFVYILNMSLSDKLISYSLYH